MSDPQGSKDGDPKGYNSDDQTRKVSPGTPASFTVFKPSKVLQRSTEALAALQKDKSGWPQLKSPEAEELVIAHRIEKPAKSSQGNVQATWSERSSQEAHYDNTAMDVQTPRSNDTQTKKRPRVGDSPEAMNTQKTREYRSERGLAGLGQLADYFSSWMSTRALMVIRLKWQMTSGEW